jgi:hypothetical protein
MAWLCGAALLWAAWSSSGYAQEDALPPAPAAPNPAAEAFGNAAAANAAEIPWGPIAQCAAYGFLVLCWAATGECVNRDSQIFGIGYKKWNPIYFFPFAAAFLGLAFAPLSFVILYPILWVVYLATAIPPC